MRIKTQFNSTTNLPIAEIGKNNARKISSKIHLTSLLFSVTLKADSSVCKPGGGEANVKSSANNAGSTNNIQLKVPNL